MYWETDTPAHCAGLARRRQAPFAGAAVEFCVNVPFGGSLAGQTKRCPFQLGEGRLGGN